MSLFRPRRTRLAAVLAAAGVVLALSACAAGSPDPAASSSPSSGASSAAASLPTLTPGTLTVATGQPAYSPWVEDNDPASGKGFESAVTYAVAKQLGFTKSQVTWTRSTFDSAIAPGAKTFDLNIQQFSVTPAREKAVDFSSPYYTTSQAVVTTKGSAAASATTLSALKAVKIGVASGTTSYSLVNSDVGVQPQVFNSVDDAVLALKSGQVQAIVTDLPTAFYLASSEVKNGVVSAQFAGTSGGDQFAFVLQKGSKLTPYVSRAVDAIRKSGELAAITKQWLSSEVDVPVLQ